MSVLEFIVGGAARQDDDRCCHIDHEPLRAECCEPAAYWYPAMGGGVARLCERHGARFFPFGAQRITDRTWHGGGQPVPPTEESAE